MLYILQCCPLRVFWCEKGLFIDIMWPQIDQWKCMGWYSTYSCNFYQGTCICYHHKLRSPCVKMNTATMNISSLTPKTKENHDFFNWKTFLVSSYEQPIVSDFTLPVTRNLEIWCSSVLSETPKKNEASATECWRTWTNHITHHRRSLLNGAGIVD